VDVDRPGVAAPAAPRLAELGWDATRATAWRECGASDDPSLQPGRVVAEHKRWLVVATVDGDYLASVAGALRNKAASRVELPAVGDWVGVAVGATGASDDAAVRVLVPRATSLVRAAAGEGREPQVLAANIDTTIVVAALDTPVNERRLERFVALVRAGGSEPVIVCTKADRVDDAAGTAGRIRALFTDVEVVCSSVVDRDGTDAVARLLVPGRTAVLLGPSGAGKSSLVNALAGAALQEVRTVRAGDAKGRHTTTARELFVLPGGALVIDTPGIRAVGLWVDDEGEALAAAFPDVLAALDAGCRFADCSHLVEPGCALDDAVAAGDLDTARVTAWRSLTTEVRERARMQDARVRRPGGAPS
jgi:ribosome biogenesis GTPase